MAFCGPVKPTKLYSYKDKHTSLIVAQHSSSIFRAPPPTGGPLKPPQGGFRGPRFQKFKKPRIQNDGPNTHPKFQHSSSIFRGPPPRGPPENPPGGFQGAPIKKRKKNAYREGDFEGACKISLESKHFKMA